VSTAAAPLHEAGARALDQADELRGWRSEFALPCGPDGLELTYLCGHSLGLAPRGARARVLEELEDWERLGVRGHEQARRPWIGYAQRLTAPLALLAGAQPQEVVAMNSLSINLHLLLASFYRPTPARHRILIEAGAFPSDRHIVASHIRWHGFDPATSLLELAPRPGEELLDMADIEQCVAGTAPSLALVLWPGVQYRTGQAFDLAAIARCGRGAGARVGFDLAHAIGNLPLALHDSGADFAAWCSYKYLNGGPGATGAAFVHERHARAAQLPRLAGWWGSNPATRFLMPGEFELSAGAAGWQVSNPPILSTAPLLASLPMFAQAGMDRLRAKSRRLTGYLEAALHAQCGDGIALITASDPDQRGAQLSIRVRGGSTRAQQVHAALGRRGVVTDWREPDTIRLAPVPLYNSYLDAWRCAAQLAAALQEPAP